jgi:hypothetical protein
MAGAGDGDALGLYSAADFAIVRGRDAEHVAGRHAAWYFADEIVAIPRTGLDVSSFEGGVRPFHNVRRFGESHTGPVPTEWPPLVWIAAPHLLRDVRMSPDAASVTTADGPTPLTLVPKLPLNQSWFDASSAAWFAKDAVTIRGTRSADSVQARVLWPETFRLGPGPAPTRPLHRSRTPGEALRTLVRETIDANAPFQAATLWERRPDADWTGKSVLAFVLNGAQGDDDEAHAGHFAIATGRIADDGAIGEWIVNNFYALDTESEKGIIAAPVPLMNYQADLNAGQSWYRPTWILVAVLDDDRAARRVQSGLYRVYLQFWRHQLPYYHPTDNCTSMSVDALRALGLDLPQLGPTSRIGAWIALPWLIARERSLAKARVAFDYLVTERTRLLPALAIESVGTALMQIAASTTAPSGTLGREIADMLAAIAWLRIPQFPSSRAWGCAPVTSLAEYRDRLPADRSKHKIVAVPPRPFPEALRDPDLLPPLPRPSDLALRGWAMAVLAAIAAAAMLRSR